MAVDLRHLFLSLQNQMAARLVTDREVIDHPIKGDAAELNWLRMFGDYLPRRYQASKAFVLDSRGSSSEQIDVVIHDRQYSPFLFNQDQSRFVPAESVYGVFEVKQNFSKEDLEYAGDKVASVRRLHRTSAPIPHAGGTFTPRPPFTILGGVLALESSWNPPLGEAFERILQSLPPDSRLDLGCALKHAAFECIYSENNSVTVERSASDTALMFFFLRLLKRLQQLATVPAMDLSEYEKALNP
jgi:hypothetical protein